MPTIITGNFQQQDAAQRALTALTSAGFAIGQTTTFFVNPPGQHATFSVGGDENESAGTHEAGTGAASGAAVGGVIGAAVGVATLPLLGPAAAVAAAGVGAYAGSLYGALVHTEDHDQMRDEAVRAGLQFSDLPRKSGMLVAVSAEADAQQVTAIRILRAYGATDGASSEGTIIDGQWTDFDPLTPLRLLPN
jgi:outer membrane lipoprotein SlyB